MTKYPEIEVKLVGQDGNAIAILFKVKKALKKAKVDGEELALFERDAMSGDYDHLLRTCMSWVTIV